MGNIRIEIPVYRSGLGTPTIIVPVSEVPIEVPGVSPKIDIATVSIEAPAATPAEMQTVETAVETGKTPPRIVTAAGPTGARGPYVTLRVGRVGGGRGRRMREAVEF